MALVLTMMARDEIDIIESNIRYHLGAGVSHVIVTDNGSIDGTRDLLADLALSLPLTLLDEAPAEWAQGKWVTTMARMAFEQFDAQWVINTDADEFFVPVAPSLIEALHDVPSGIDVLRVSRNDFVSIERPGLEPPPLEMVYRKRVSLHGLSGQPIASKAIHRGCADVVVTQGCHDARSDSFRAATAVSTISTSHYPIRSLEQFTSSVRNAGSGYAIMTDLAPSTGSHKRHWYQLLQQGALDVEYFEHQHYLPAEVDGLLQSGELIEDRTLAWRLAELR